MNYQPEELPSAVSDFLSERHLATLSIPRDGDAPHVTPVGFTWDSAEQLARVITFKDAKKVRLLEAEAGGVIQVSICQVDGGKWLALSGNAEVTRDAERCRQGEELYGIKYQPPKNRGEDRRVIEVKVGKIIGRVPD